ncbi:hypothetical protein D3C84_993220 [compost metagenome]
MPPKLPNNSSNPVTAPTDCGSDLASASESITGRSASKRKPHTASMEMNIHCGIPTARPMSSSTLTISEQSTTARARCPRSAQRGRAAAPAMPAAVITPMPMPTCWAL